MSPREQPNPAPAGRERGDVDVRPMTWMMWLREVFVVLAFTSVLILAVNLPLTATWSRQKLAFLVLVSCIPAIFALQGGLVALGHPWVATTYIRTQERRFNHPRLVGLTQVWAGILVAGWLCAMILLFSYPLVPVTYAVFLAGLGPWLAMLLFDRRR